MLNNKTNKDDYYKWYRTINNNVWNCPILEVEKFHTKSVTYVRQINHFDNYERVLPFVNVRCYNLYKVRG